MKCRNEMIGLPVDLKARIKAEAEAEGKTIVQYIRDLIK